MSLNDKRSILVGMVQQNTNAKLSICLFYGLPAMALAMLGIVYFVYLPKMYVDLGIVSVAGLGFGILFTRIFDAVLDPWVGRISDVHLGNERRKPFIKIALIPLVIAFAILLLPQLGTDLVSPVVWFLSGSVLFFVAWTFYAVPYEALGTELSFDYNQRTKLFAWRDGLLVGGTLLAVVLVEGLRAFFNSQAAAIFWTGFLVILILIFSSIGLLAFVKETIGQKVPGQERELGKVWASAWANKAFRILLIAFVLNGFGAALPATLILFFVQYVLGADSGGLYLLLYLGVGIISFPAWVWISSSWNKKGAWLLASIINSGAFAFTLSIGPGDFFSFAVICVLSGFGFSGVLLIPSAMQADVIDYQEQLTGQRQEGGLVGIWSIARKLSAALGAGVALPILDWVGFIPNQIQSDLVLATLSGLYAGIPVLCTLLAIYFIAKYPLSRAQHEEITRFSASRWINNSINQES